MRTGIVLTCLVWSAGAAAQSGAQGSLSSARFDADSVIDLVVTAASCAALHAAAADALDHANLAGHAATARRRAEADQLTAMYLLAEDRAAKGGTHEPLTRFAGHVEQLTAAAYERMKALVTNDDASSFEREEDFCARLIPLEDEILGKIPTD
jgi:hypothetical protein